MDKVIHINDVYAGNASGYLDKYMGLEYRKEDNSSKDQISVSYKGLDGKWHPIEDLTDG